MSFIVFCGLPGSGKSTVARAVAARNTDGACLVSWWRPPHVTNPSGTPAEWLAELRPPVVQVHCRCRVETAVERFLSRRRHPGHLDSVRSRESLRREFAELADAVPIRDGVVIAVDTEGEVDIDLLAEELLVTFAAAGDR